MYIISVQSLFPLRVTRTYSEFLLNTFDNFVHIVHFFGFSYALAPSIVVTFLVVLVRAPVGAAVHAVSGGGMWCADTPSVALETEVGKPVLFTSFGATTC